MVRCQGVVLGVLLAVAVPATVTLDFSELHGTDGCSFEWLDTQGFHVASTFGHWQESHCFIAGDPALQAAADGAYSFARITRLDGGRFRFLDLDVSSNGAPFGQIYVLGHAGGEAPLSQDMTVTTADRYEKFVSLVPDVWLEDMYVQMYPTSGSGAMNVDNARFETVPEPCAVALSGLVLSAGLRRRRRAYRPSQ